MPLSFKLSALHQVEYAVADLAVSQRFFQQVLGESEVEKDFSSVLTNPALDISHAGFARTVQQFCQPLMAGLPHYDALQAYGTCVHNLCYLVDNIDHIVANCRDAGFEPLLDFPLEGIWAEVIGADNLQGNHHSYIIDTKAVLGFHLELAETPWINEPQPPLMLPALGPQWEALDVATTTTLLGINIVVEDLAQTLAALQSVFVDNLTIVTDISSAVECGVDYMIVELGLVRLVYLQPLEGEAPCNEFLQVKGPAVYSLVAQVEDLDAVSRAAGVFDVAVDQPLPALLLAAQPSGEAVVRAVQLHSLEQVGVEFTLIQKG